MGVCTIPHSSASCERVFSCVRKNLTDQRSTLHQDTLEALLVLKSRPEETREFRPEDILFILFPSFYFIHTLVVQKRRVSSCP
ncbi:hypothetical protein BaRGS_00020174 [Batillaria attramentaria]|uniref:HAT C-terminal dimerisation domain-containing protein n=1 Tax=Batillaria attramentaria TaxID=370345 RepID=A0ABD0KN72_9CAEN